MRERAISFGEDPRLVGVVCKPQEGRGPEAPVFLLLNAGILHRVGPSRMNVHLARALAAVGFASLRFDFAGVGDSEASRDGRPFQERAVGDVRMAMDHLEETLGSPSFVLFGLCSGAEVGHAAAVADARVVGMALIDGHVFRTWRYYVHRYGPRLLRGRSWLNLLSGKTYIGPFLRRLSGTGSEADSQQSIFAMHRPKREEVEADLRTLVARRVRMLQVFTGGLDDLCTYGGQFRDCFRSIDFRDLLEAGFFSEADHTFTALEEQERLIRTVVRWSDAGWPASAADRGTEPPEGRVSPTPSRSRRARNRIP